MYLEINLLEMDQNLEFYHQMYSEIELKLFEDMYILLIPKLLQPIKIYFEKNKKNPKNSHRIFTKCITLT